jgi:hypothetical protein
MRNLRRRVALERDLRELQRRHGAVLGAVPEPTGGTALLASLSHSPFQLKLEGMLAKGLQLAGADVAAAVPSAGTLPRRYLETFGISRFVTLAEDGAWSSSRSPEREAARILADVGSTEELKELAFRGAGVGRQALSTVSRHLHEGAVDLSDPDTRAGVDRFLALAIRMTYAAERLLDDVAPETLVFNERNYAAEGPLSDLALARGLNVLQFVAGFADDALVFKRFTQETKGLHPRSLSRASWERVKTMHWTPERDRELEEDFDRRYAGETYVARLHRGWTRRQSRDEIAERLGLDPARKTAVVFSHVLWDANMFYGRDLFDDQEQWFVETVRAACANTDVNWLVKLHPANLWKLRRDGYRGELDEHRALREHIGALPDHVRVLEPDVDVSPWSLFPLVDWGVTIRGSVGFELPCFGTPVLTAGTGFYSGRGFTVDSSSREQYLARLRELSAIPRLDEHAVELARRHAYALFRLRQTRFTSFRQIYFVDSSGAAEATIGVSVASAEELFRSRDLRAFGDWAVNSRELDYLEDLPE